MASLRNLIKEALEEHLDKSLMLKENVNISESLQYHIDNGLTLTNNIFRVYSKGYFNLVNEVRDLWTEGKIQLNEEDTLMVESDLGKRVKIGEQLIYLDAPFEVEEDEVIEEAKHRGKNVQLGKPFRTPGGPKKFAVYVKGKNNKVKIVRFGDPNLKIKNYDKKAAKSFKARHKCHLKKDRTKPGYWSCNIARYRKLLGLKSSNRW